MFSEVFEKIESSSCNRLTSHHRIFAMLKAIDNSEQNSRFNGRTEDVAYLKNRNIRIQYAVEWKLRSDFTTHMKNRIGLIIGRNGRYLSDIREEVNRKHNMEDAVLGIWGKELTNGDFVFSAYGNNDQALLDVVSAIKFKSEDIMKLFGWYVYEIPFRIVAKRLVDRWDTTREFGTPISNADSLFAEETEEMCFQRCPHGTPYNTSWCGGWMPILKELMD